MKKIKKIFLAIKHYLNGDFAYQHYLQHHAKHPQKKLLSKEEFLNQKRCSKWDDINKCC